jgi:hypothetical protein
VFTYKSDHERARKEIWMMEPLLLLGGASAATLTLGWLTRRYDRNIDGYQEREYQPPLVFAWPPVG